MPQALFYDPLATGYQQMAQTALNPKNDTMTETTTYSVLIAWHDGDREQGDFSVVVKAGDAAEAEQKARDVMRDSLIEQYGNDRTTEYEREEIDGTIIFGGSLLDLSEGAIWEAAELESALRELLAQVDERACKTGWPDNRPRERARAILARIDNMGA